MRFAATAAPIVLALVVAAFALPSLALAADPITEAEAVETAQQLAARVGAYSVRRPDDAGAFAPWAGEEMEADVPLLIHSYPALEPVVLLRDADTTRRRQRDVRHGRRDDR